MKFTVRDYILKILNECSTRILFNTRSQKPVLSINDDYWLIYLELTDQLSITMDQPVNDDVREIFIRARKENNVNKYTVRSYRCAEIALKSDWQTVDDNQSNEQSGETENDGKCLIEER